MKFIFKDEDLLTFQEIENYINTESGVDRTDIIYSKIKKYMVLNGKKLYLLSENNKYELYTEDNEKYINRWVTRFLDASNKKLSNEQQRILKSDYKKKFDIINVTKINYIDNLMCDLEEKDIINNDITGQIHFNNGYLDLNTLEFKQRDVNHYVSLYIKNDYIPSTEQQRKKIFEQLRKTYPNEEDLKVILNVIGAAITGKSHLESEILFLLGTGASGKSKIMELCKAAFDVYVKSLVSNAFSAKNDKASKTVAGFLDKMPTRISWVNELKNEKIDDSLFKQIVDGEATTTQAYKDGNFDVSVKHKIFITANEIANVKMDSGIIRRIRAYTHKSTFIKKKDDNGNDLFENPKNHIYYADTELLNNIIKEGLLNAFIDIVTKYSQKYMKGEKIQYTEAFNETKKLLTQADDKMQDFIDSQLVITNDEKMDIIGRQRMLELYANFTKKKIQDLNHSVLLSGMKDKKIKYDCDRKVNNLKGCYVGVVERTLDYIDTDENKNEDENEDTNKPTYDDLLRQISELKRELEESTRRYKLIANIEYKKNEKELDMSQPNEIPVKFSKSITLNTTKNNINLGGCDFTDSDDETVIEETKPIKKVKIVRPKKDDDNESIKKEEKKEDNIPIKKIKIEKQKKQTTKKDKTEVKTEVKTEAKDYDAIDDLVDGIF